MSSTSTSHVAQVVKTLNISCDNLSTISTAGDINPLSALAALQAFSISSKNPFFKISDGVLFNSGESVLYFYPRYKATQSYTLPSLVDSIMPQTVLEQQLENFHYPTINYHSLHQEPLKVLVIDHSGQG